MKEDVRDYLVSELKMKNVIAASIVNKGHAGIMKSDPICLVWVSSSMEQDVLMPFAKFMFNKAKDKYPKLEELWVVIDAGTGDGRDMAVMVAEHVRIGKEEDDIPF